jgi:predicted nucleotidyltransferase
MDSQIINTGILSDFCKKNHIKKLSLFGSYLTDNKTAKSDIDLLVEFREGHVPGYLGLCGMETELSELMGGIKVDLRTYKELSRYFRDEVASRAVVQYEN